MVFGSAAPCFALLADGTRLYCRTAVRLYWPKMEGRLCVYLMNVSMYRFCELYLVGARDGKYCMHAGTSMTLFAHETILGRM
jgi:hypothetical protein